jgi:Ca-activated chloride channel family protein
VPADESANSKADDKNVAAEDDIPPSEPDDIGNPVDVARNAKAAKSLHSKKPFNRWEVEALPAYPPVNGLDIPDEVDAERVGILVHVNGGMPIAELASPTHKLSTERPTPEHVDVRLADGRTIDNKNFILTYRLAGASNQAGLLGYRDQRGGFFSLLIEPPAIPAEADVTPREMVFVLDCSGSMSGLPMEASKAFMREALAKLRPTDHFRIIRFSDAATEFSAQPMPATPDNIQAGIKYADSLAGEGGTEMSTGIRQALVPPVPANTVRLVSFLTDGYIGNESEILALIKANLNGARLYAFGVGAEVNRYLLNEMSIVGRGFARYMDPTENVEKVASELVNRLQSPVLTDIDIDWGGLSVSEQSPAAIPDLFAGQSVRVQGRYAYPGTYLIKVKGLVNGRHASLPMQVSLPESSQQGEAVPVIWARSAIAQTMRALTTADMSNSEASQKDQSKQKVIDLGLEFFLVTQWTSFVAVSEKVYNPHPEQAKDTRVPLPMVKGTTPLAYGKPAIAPMQTAMNGGFAGYGAPEPGVVAGFAVIFMMFAGFFWRGARRVSCA